MVYRWAVLLALLWLKFVCFILKICYVKPKSIPQGILHWYRCVNDVFAISSSKPDFDTIMIELDSIHPNIKFHMNQKLMTELIF